MATVFVDLVNLDGSRPEGRLKFSLEQLRIGDPDVVPSSVEVAIIDGKARVENLLPGEMKVQVSTGRWSKEWPVAIPDNGTHDLFDLLGTSAPEFERALWATLLERVEKLEQRPAPEPFDPADLPNLKPALIQAAFNTRDDEGVKRLSENGIALGGFTWSNRVEIRLSGKLDRLAEFFKDSVSFDCFPKPALGTLSHELWFYGGSLSYREFDYFFISSRSGRLYLHDRMRNTQMTETTEGAFYNAAVVNGAERFHLKIVYYTSDLPAAVQ